jgi:flagellar motility protein MotE (MotC chaperone)
MQKTRDGMKKTAAQIRVEIAELDKERKKLLKAATRGRQFRQVNMRWVHLAELEWRIRALEEKLRSSYSSL